MEQQALLDDIAGGAAVPRQGLHRLRQVMEARCLWHCLGTFCKQISSQQPQSLSKNQSHQVQKTTCVRSLDKSTYGLLVLVVVVVVLVRKMNSRHEKNSRQRQELRQRLHGQR